MSHTVVRGEPYPSQVYVDSILDEVLASRGKALTVQERKNVNLGQILYHCLKKNPSNVFMINGATGEVITNGQILRDAVSLARALLAKGAREKTVTLVMRNHQRMTAMYLAAIFAGSIPAMQDPNTTAFEVAHFLRLIEPHFVFCDEEHKAVLQDSLKGLPELETEVVVMQSEENLKNFTRGYSDDVEGFDIPNKEPESAVMMLPTSGSTGLPKATVMTEQGLVAQLAIPWCYDTVFPRPTELMMVLTTLQWMTFTMMLTSGVAMQIPLLITPEASSVRVVKDLLIKYRPTWTFFGPTFIKGLLAETSEDHFSSLRTVTLLGAPATLELLAAIKAKLPANANLLDSYGTTETQGYIAITDPDAPLKSNGKVLNIFHYKMIDENNKEVGLGQNGELYVKGISCIREYYKNQEVYEETFTDGWYKTGDLFHIDENERIFYLERIKFNFKFQGCHVSPEEVEGVINQLPGVQECVVCSTEAGPAAAVVVRPASHLTRDEIHDAVNAALSEHKRLHGGIVFVPSLPHTHSGKLRRTECQKIIQELIKTEACR